MTKFPSDSLAAKSLRLGLLFALLAGLTTSPAFADSSALSYDPAGNIISRTSPLGATTYSYDALNRLVSETGPAGIQTYTYDANGNRLTDSLGSYTYSPATNRMTTRRGLAVSVDAAGHVTSDGQHTFVYNQAGRLSQVLQGTTLLASYYYNYKGERTRKTTTAAAPQGAQTVIYHYDEANHLLAETTGTGAPLRTYVWRDDTPIAQIDHVPTRRVIYFDVDHLDTPRLARDQLGNVVWRWEGDAFGSTPPNENPSGGGVVTVNLRFPGQYFDIESGLSYNGNRDYDSSTGRYVQSDPIGLAGGVNPYTYVDGNPLSRIDPLGLSDIVITVNRTTTTNTSTMGAMSLTVNGQSQFQGYSLEPSGTGGTNRLSPGAYGASVYASPRLRGQNVLLLNNTAPMTFVEMHPGNTPSDTRGCILPGITQSQNSVGGSRDAFNRIMNIINNTQQSDVTSGQPTTISVQVQ